MIKSARVRVLLVILLLLSATLTAVWVLQRRFLNRTVLPQSVARQIEPAEKTPIPTPSPPIVISSTPTVPEMPSESSPELPAVAAEPSPALTLEPSYIGRLRLITPVKGVRPDQLLDTFKDARSEGRVHDAIDIPAPAGTPVVAAAEGDIVKLFQSDRGGITIYQSSVDQKLIFYYAHLQGYADGIYVGKRVWQGETIGYVGDTGNAGAGNYHLHFSIMITNDPKRYWEGTNINPFPLLRP